MASIQNSSAQSCHVQTSLYIDVFSNGLRQDVVKRVRSALEGWKEAVELRSRTLSPHVATLDPPIKERIEQDHCCLSIYNSVMSCLSFFLTAFEKNMFKPDILGSSLTVPI